MFVKHPGAAGEDLLGTATTQPDAASGLSGPPPASGFPTSFLIPEAAFVIGVSDETMQRLIERDHCTVLRTEDGDEFITLAQLDRLDDLIGLVEREIREAA